MDPDRGKAAANDKIWADQPDAAGMDELFAVLGYKVRTSDMGNVAERLEQLDMAMATSSAAGDDAASVIASNTVHYNPSDLFGWVESVLSELSNSINEFPGDSSNAPADSTAADDDLRAIFGSKRKDLIGDCENGIAKRMKMNSSPRSDQFCENQPPAARPVVLMDSQETGVRLVHALMACAEAVDLDDLKLGEALVKHVGILAAAQIAGAMRKVATYFAEALARKIYKIYPTDSLDPYNPDVLHLHFYETTPYLKFAHFTANQAILEAVAGATSVHVIDFSLKQGMQWPELMQALARRPEGPPAFRLTGIGPAQPENTDALQEVGWKLSEFAQAIGVKFEFRGLVANSLADLDANIVELRPSAGETVAVNSVFELHQLLALPGAIDRVLSSIKGMNPKIVTVVEQEARHNSGGFLERFNSALHYYSTMFDSLESGSDQINVQDSAMAEAYLGRQICNVVACEGADRVERHETLIQWRGRMKSAGFESVHLGSEAYKRASLLLAHFTGGDGYGVQENEGCLMLGWHTRPLVATSAWRLCTAAQ